jgi:hypothetical protein
MAPTMLASHSEPPCSVAIENRGRGANGDHRDLDKASHRAEERPASREGLCGMPSRVPASADRDDHPQTSLGRSALRDRPMSRDNPLTAEGLILAADRLMHARSLGVARAADDLWRAQAVYDALKAEADRRSGDRRSPGAPDRNRPACAAHDRARRNVLRTGQERRQSHIRLQVKP